MAPIVIIFIGLPGTGKTTIATHIQHTLPHSVIIEQDLFYKKHTCDSYAYLGEIEKCLSKHQVLLLCKNHHTSSSLMEVVTLVKSHHAQYLLVNLIPDLVVMTRDETDLLEDLLERIENRNNGSHIKIDEHHSRQLAKNKILYGFLKKYEPPNIKDHEFYISLDYKNSITKNVNSILTQYKKMKK